MPYCNSSITVATINVHDECAAKLSHGNGMLIADQKISKFACMLNTKTLLRGWQNCIQTNIHSSNNLQKIECIESRLTVSYCSMKYLHDKDAPNSHSKYSHRSHLHISTLQWRHIEHDGVSNHQPDHCLLKRLFMRQSNKTSPVICEFPSQRASNASNAPFDDVIIYSLKLRGEVTHICVCKLGRYLFI